MAVTFAFNPNQSIDDSPKHYFGLASDTKPTIASHSGLPTPTVGSDFYEYDTRARFVTYDGTSWFFSGNPILKQVGVTKELAAAAAYDAGDVVSESSTNATGTAWTFSAIAAENGGTGKLIKAHVISETTALTTKLVLYLFTATPTCELDDHAANTCLLYADVANYVGRIEFAALSEFGTGASEAVAVPGTTLNLPLAFKCASGADDLYGVLVTQDAFTQGAGKSIRVILTAECY